jgi:hypothetical protein
MASNALRTIAIAYKDITFAEFKRLASENDENA